MPDHLPTKLVSTISNPTVALYYRCPCSYSENSKINYQSNECHKFDKSFGILGILGTEDKTKIPNIKVCFLLGLSRWNSLLFSTDLVETQVPTNKMFNIYMNQVTGFN